MRHARQYLQTLVRCQPRIKSLVDSVRCRSQALLWPGRCLLCLALSQRPLDLCRECEADLVLNDCACSVCADPLPAASASVVLCGACLRHAPAFDWSYVPYRYAYPLDHLITALKFRNSLAGGRVLGELFTHRLLAARREPLPELLVPVPLAAARHRERGYNQAMELALPVRRLTRITVRADLVVRQRETAEQSALGRKERRRNLRRAFALTAPLPARHVAILDDVMTTGSTANELAKVLRRAGAKRIEVWAIARAASRGDFGVPSAAPAQHHEPRKTYSSAMPTNTDIPK